MEIYNFDFVLWQQIIKITFINIGIIHTNFTGGDLNVVKTHCILTYIGCAYVVTQLYHFIGNMFNLDIGHVSDFLMGSGPCWISPSTHPFQVADAAAADGLHQLVVGRPHWRGWSAALLPSPVH